MAQRLESAEIATPPEMAAQALREFETYLGASAEQQLRIVERLRLERPAVALALERLVQGHADAGQTLEMPALDRITPISIVSHPSHSFKWHVPRSSFARLVMGVACAVLLLHVWVAALLFRFGDAQTDTGWDGIWNGSNIAITSVDPHGPAAGKLLRGDRITAVNGDSGGIFAAFLLLPVDRSLGYRLRIERVGAKPFEVTLHEGIRRNRFQTLHFATFVLVAALFSLVAFAIAALKPQGSVARLAAAALLAEAIVVLGDPAEAYRELLGAGESWLVWMISVPAGIQFALAFHFYSAFFEEIAHNNPQRAPRQSGQVRRSFSLVWRCVRRLVRFEELPGARRRAWQIATLYGLGGAVSLFFQIENAPLLRHVFGGWTKLLQGLLLLHSVYYLLAPIVICGLIAVSYWKARRTPGEIRARWIAFGSLAGIVPYALYRVYLGASQWMNLPIDPTARQYALEACILAAAVIPFSTAYAVLRYRVFDIELFIRSGLQYAVLSRGWWALPAIPFAGMLLLLASNRNRTVAEAMGQDIGFLLLLALCVVLLAARGRVQRWLNGRYDRDEVKRAEKLRLFVAAIRKSTSLDDLAARVDGNLALIHNRVRASIGFRDEHDGFFMIRGSGLPEEGVRLHAHSALMGAVQRAGGGPQLLDEMQSLAPDSEEINEFASAGIDCVVLLPDSKGDVRGVLLLDSAREGYSRSHLNGLRAAAEEVAAVAEALRREKAALVRADENRATLRQSLLLECPACGLCFDNAQTHCSGDGSALVFTFALSRVVSERYRLDKRLDAGGMGTVFEGRDLKLNRQIAVKVITPPPGAQSEAWGRRAIREARVLAKLRHPNVVTAYDYGTVESGIAYLVMEYVRGQTLRRILSQGRVCGELAAEWFDRILDGLAAAHSAGIIHRDLKPENIMVGEPDTAGETVKILDFGIAKTIAADDAASCLTLAGARLGTPIYMSPEQFDGLPVDVRSDIFSVGVILLEVLTGALPFSQSSLRHRFVAWLHGEGTLPVAGEADMLLNNALRRCLAPNREARFSSVAELRREVVPLIRSYRGGVATGGDDLVVSAAH